MTTLELHEKYVLGTYGRFPVSFTHGSGTELWDESGKRYLDFGSGIAVCSLGHAPPVMQQALAEQSANLIHCSNLYQIRAQAELAQWISDVAMERAGKTFFSNSGAEANDGLIKLARKRSFDRHGPNTEKVNIVTCQKSFHGRTLGGIAATGQEKVKIGFDPLLPGFIHVPFNDCDALRAAVDESTAAILLEPVQGEGGIHVATPEFLQTVDQLRNEYDCLILFDEVQCGFGRTGDWCAWRSILRDSEFAVEPDGVSWAKGMGGGFPIGAFWVADEYASHLGPGTHGSTYGGSPLASTVALQVLQSIAADRLCSSVVGKETLIRKTLLDLSLPLITEVRGLGLLLGVAFDLEHAGGLYDPEATVPLSIQIVAECLNEGLLVVPAGPDVVRIIPPLNVSEALLEEGLTIMQKVLTRFCAS